MERRGRRPGLDVERATTVIETGFEVDVVKRGKVHVERTTEGKHNKEQAASLDNPVAHVDGASEGDVLIQLDGSQPVAACNGQIRKRRVLCKLNVIDRIRLLADLPRLGHQVRVEDEGVARLRTLIHRRSSDGILPTHLVAPETARVSRPKQGDGGSSSVLQHLQLEQATVERLRRDRAAAQAFQQTQ